MSSTCRSCSVGSACDASGIDEARAYWPPRLVGTAGRLARLEGIVANVIIDRRVLEDDRILRVLRGQDDAPPEQTSQQEKVGHRSKQFLVVALLRIKIELDLVDREEMAVQVEAVDMEDEEKRGIFRRVEDVLDISGRLLLNAVAAKECG